MKKIYLACFDAGWRSGDVLGYALVEDGYCIATHLSSNVSFSMHDMGLTSNWKHENYNKYCGEGEWELEWVDDPDNHVGWQEALAINQKLKDEENSKE